MARRPSKSQDRRPELLLEFCVEGVAVSAQSGNRARLRAWKDRVALRAKEALAGKAMIDGAIELSLSEFGEFRSKDRDNFVKPIQDAMQGVLFWTTVRWRDWKPSGAISTADIDCASCRRWSRWRSWQVGSYMSSALSSPSARDLDPVMTDAKSRERREISTIARRYRRDGYKVTGPNELAGRPSFLEDFVPDLIAERDDDKVIVEVKRAPALRGSNQLVDLAERVARQPGWRVELVVVPGPTSIAKPDLDGVERDVRQLVGQGFSRPAFIFLYAAIENLVAFASAKKNRNPANYAFPALVREMVVMGIIDEDLRRKLEEGWAVRNTMLHDTSAVAPSHDDVEKLMTLAQSLEKDLLEAPAKV